MSLRRSLVALCLVAMVSLLSAEAFALGPAPRTRAPRYRQATATSVLGRIGQSIANAPHNIRVARERNERRTQVRAWRDANRIARTARQVVGGRRFANSGNRQVTVFVGNVRMSAGRLSYAATPVWTADVTVQGLEQRDSVALQDAIMTHDALSALRVDAMMSGARTTVRFSTDSRGRVLSNTVKVSTEVLDQRVNVD